MQQLVSVGVDDTMFDLLSAAAGSIIGAVLMTTPSFVKMLENGIENGYIEKYPQDDFDYDNEEDFDDIQDMYSDDIELEHSSCCICRIPEDWKTQ
jgi:hypothetical protein